MLWKEWGLNILSKASNKWTKMAYPLTRLKEHLKINAGDTGIKIFQTSVEKLKIGDNPSQDQIKNLTKEIEKNLVLFFGSARTKEMLGKLELEAGQEEQELDSELRGALENIFNTKGIPIESDLLGISGYIVTKGYEGDEKKVLDILKQLSREKVLLALNDNIIRYEVQRFIDKYPSFKMEDMENFIKYIKDQKLEVNRDALLDMVEKERLYRKFEEKNQEESWQDKISRQYIGLLNTPKSVDYEYLIVDEALTSQLLKKISK